MRTAVFFIIALVFLLAHAPAHAAGKEGFKFGKDPEIGQIRPGKPAKIKLKRNASGKYTWEITGDSVEEVTRADRELREYLKIKTYSD
jgi:hypothetical protein